MYYSTGLAYLLWFLSGFGALGFHRFYLGKPGTGLLWMFSGGLFGLGSIYDLFTLPRQVDEANMMRFIRERGTPAGNGFETRRVNDGESRILHKAESVELAILRVAREKRGIVTPSGAALEAGCSIDEAKKQLESMVTKGHAELRVRHSGALVYVFPEFMDDSELEDF